MITVEFETDVPILRESRDAVPEMTITLETEQAPGTGTNEPIRLLFWAAGGDHAAFKHAIEADPTVTDPSVFG